MHAAGIISRHAAQRVVVVRGRIGPEGQAMFFRLTPQIVQHAAGLHPGIALLHIQLDNAVQIFREVDDHRDIAALPGETRAAAAIGDRRAEAAADRDRALHLFQRLRNHDADRHLAVIRCIRRV